MRDDVGDPGPAGGEPQTDVRDGVRETERPHGPLHGVPQERVVQQPVVGVHDVPQRLPGGRRTLGRTGECGDADLVVEDDGLGGDERSLGVVRAGRHDGAAGQQAP